ncbi:MAG: phosphonoacetaldehyde hydrolase [Terriglobia bacterium]
MVSDNQHRYQGPVRAVIFDWAGTTVDYGSRAPVDAFIELFRRHGVTVTAEQARGPMGSHKKDHVRLILAMQPVAQQWQQRYDRAASADDVEMLFQEFIPLQTEVIRRHTDVIPGVAEAVKILRQQGIVFGATTGYTRAMMAALLVQAAAAGFAPESNVCADEVAAGRPAPWMAITAAMQLGVYPMQACVKVGDTLVDIAEGLNAGMWTVGITKTGNELGLCPDDVEALPARELATRLNAASNRFLQAGAHAVIPEVAKLPTVIAEINERLAGGEKP